MSEKDIVISMYEKEPDDILDETVREYVCQHLYRMSYPEYQRWKAAGFPYRTARKESNPYPNAAKK
jgi:hypothetical protein